VGLTKAPEDQLLELAKAVVLREQDVAARELDVARRRQELEDKERELAVRKRELQQLRFDFSATAKGDPVRVAPPTHVPSVLAKTKQPSLARTQATVAQRVLVLLEMEPRALSPMEIFNMLELPPPIETLRTTLWKMENNGLIARPFPGHYCALQFASHFSPSVTG
jgi:hypothetical protein